jgi:hypothetical protein
MYQVFINGLLTTNATVEKPMWGGDRRVDVRLLGTDEGPVGHVVVYDFSVVPPIRYAKNEAIAIRQELRHGYHIVIKDVGED